MTSGGDINAVYSKYGSNNEDVILIMSDPLWIDTKTKVVEKYEYYGTTPLFPVVLEKEGGAAISSLLGTGIGGGPTIILHPNRRFVSTGGYSEEILTSAIDAALEDGCDQTSVSLKSNSIVEGRTAYIDNKGIHLKGFNSRKVEVSLFSLSGRMLFKKVIKPTEGICSFNINKFNNQIVLLKVSKPGKTYSFKLLSR